MASSCTLGEQFDGGIHEPEAMRSQRDLLDGFFAGDVQTTPRRADCRRRLQQQRRLADARVPAKQDDAACDEPSDKHPVELIDARRRAWIRQGLDP
jgi:hypothetical protein